MCVPTLMRRAGWAPLLGLGVLLAGADVAAAQESGAVLAGTVYDSTTETTLAGARVALWGTSAAVLTDAAGRFEIRGIPQGEYSVVFFHPRLATLGVSVAGQGVTLSAARRTTIRLATPSMQTITRQYCTLEPSGPGAGMAFGLIEDPETAVPFPGARVELSWVDERGVTREAHTEADGQGWYRFCDVPGGVAAEVQARFLNRVSARKAFVPPSGGTARVDFKLSTRQPATVEGVLLDAESGEPIANAEVELVGVDRETVSDVQGRFRFEDVRPGDYPLRVSHVAFGTQTRELGLTRGGQIEVEVRLAMQPIELPAMSISVRSEENTGVVPAGGRVISREDVERLRHRARDVADLLRAKNMSGVVVRRQGQDVCIGSLSGQARMSARGPCVPMVVFIDGVRATDPYLAVTLSAEAVDRMVVYRPLEAGTLFGLGSGNGVLLIFTRDAHRR